MRKDKWLVAVAVFCSVGALSVAAQVNTAPSRIVAPVNDSNLVVLGNTVAPLARSQYDRGLAPNSLPMKHMLLILKRSPQQEAALKSLLAEQQDRTSPNYHKWITPSQFGAEFGPSNQDIQTITAWLQSNGFTVNSVSAGRTVIDFSGTASTVQSAFHTAIHRYVLPNGEQHWANSTSIEIPAALTPVVAGIRSLNNFFPKPQYHTAVHPAFTFAYGGSCGPNTTNCFDVTPDDFKTIYNVTGTWTGANQTIAIVSDSDISPTDLQRFRNLFGLTAMTMNGPSSSAPSCTSGVPCFTQFIPPTQTDPGIQCPNPGQSYSPPSSSCPSNSNGNESEAILDAEWAGTPAPAANIWLVSSADTSTSFGADLSATYVVNCPTTGPSCPVAVPANVLSTSYGLCESALGAAGNQFYSTTWQQAAAEGITVVADTADSGSAGCDYYDPTTGPPQPAEKGLAVDGTSSTPYNVAVGGTDFDQASNPAQYWSTTNSSTGESALGYIPETAWNDSCTNGFFGTDPIADCNNSNNSAYVFALGGGGGASSCATFAGSSCAAGYPKPCWQMATLTAPCTQAGVATPSDGVRDLPDVSLFASNGFMASAYIVCQADSSVQAGTSCSLAQPPASGSATASYEEVGGTSVSAQAFAGIAALIDQQAGGSQGNIDPTLYALAGQSGNTCNSAANPASTCVFYDVTSGTITQPCDISLNTSTPSPDCTSSGSNQLGVLESGGQPAYNAGTGYDLATGLGSINVTNLLCSWPSGTVICTTTALQASASAIPVGQSVTLTATVTPQSGTGTPTGTVNFVEGTTTIGSGTLNGSGVATFATTSLAVGTHSITAAYQGDSNFAASTSAAVQVQVNGSPDFLVSASPSSQTVTPGGATSYSLTLTPQNGFNQAVSISCTGVPALATCTPASSSVTLNGTSASQVQINVTTTAASLLPPTAPPFGGWQMMAIVAAFLLLCLLVAERFTRRSLATRRWLAGAGFAVVIAFAVIGCGGNNSKTTSPGTQPGTYTLTLKGTSGSTTHSTTVSLVVQ